MSCTVNIKAAEISNPTLIFSPGAWHTGAAFKPTTDVLTKQGYKCIALDLPTIGSELRNESPPQSWDPDVSHIRSTILEELDEKNVNVILVVHSYSGTVGSEACKGLDEKSRKAQGKRTWVKSLVYLSAIVMDVGAYIWEYSNGKPLDERRTIMKGDLCYVDDTASWFYNECSPAMQETLLKQLQSHAWKAFLSKVTYTAWRDIPSWFLYSTNDAALTIDMQKASTSLKGGKWKTMTCNADHSPMVSRVEAVVKIVKAAAGDEK